MRSIPVVDYADYLSQDENRKHEFIQAVGDSLKDIGFFALKNHGIPLTAIDDAYNANDKDAQAEARKDLAAAFRLKAKSVNLKYIAPPKSTDFAIVYVPTEGLFAELSSYRDPKTKELLLEFS